MHAIGIDVSSFNSFIANCKINKYDISLLEKSINIITENLIKNNKFAKDIEFEQILIEKLKEFNDRYFPVPEYKYKLKRRFIDEDKYGQETERQFLAIYKGLIKEYKMELLKQNPKNFLEKWYFKNVIDEINFVFDEIRNVKDTNNKNILVLMLSRTMRSCRATTHSDLSTLIEQLIITLNMAKYANPYFLLSNGGKFIQKIQ